MESHTSRPRRRRSSNRIRASFGATLLPSDEILRSLDDEHEDLRRHIAKLEGKLKRQSAILEALSDGNER